MLTRFVVAFVALIWCSVAFGQATGSFTPSSPGQYTPVSDTAAQSLTVPPNANYAVVCAEGTNHRYTWDGSTTPTSTVGTLLLQNGCVSLSGAQLLSAFKIIQVSVGGTFTVSYAK